MVPGAPAERIPGTEYGASKAKGGLDKTRSLLRMGLIWPFYAALQA